MTGLDPVFYAFWTAVVEMWVPGSSPGTTE